MIQRLVIVPVEAKDDAAGLCLSPREPVALVDVMHLDLLLLAGTVVSPDQPGEGVFQAVQEVHVFPGYLDGLLEAVIQMETGAGGHDE